MTTLANSEGRSGRFDEDNDPIFTKVGLCHSCKNRVDAGTCRAFPDGIPARVLVGKLIHAEPIPGDHGIQYEPIVL